MGVISRVHPDGSYDVSLTNNALGMKTSTLGNVRGHNIRRSQSGSGISKQDSSVEFTKLEEGAKVEVEAEDGEGMLRMGWRSKRKLAKVYKHGQYEGASIGGTFGQANKRGKKKGRLEDDHHCPLTAEGYLKLRVKPQLAFYQSRLPKYGRMRGFFEVGLLLGR